MPTRSSKILEPFGEECVGRDTKTRIDQLKEYLLTSFREGTTCVLLIHEAQQMKGHLLESLRGLLSFEVSIGGKMLQIILFAMPGSNRKSLYGPSLRNRIVRTETNNDVSQIFTSNGSFLIRSPFRTIASGTVFLLDASPSVPRVTSGRIYQIDVQSF